MENSTPSTSTELAKMESYASSILDLDLPAALVQIKAEIEALDASDPSDKDAVLSMFLESLWHFFLSFQMLTEKADFQSALQYIQIANQGFINVNFKPLELFSRGLELYLIAIVDIKSSNLKAGLDRLKEAKSHFVKVDKYGERYKLHIEAMEAESLFISGLVFSNQLDYENALLSIEKAAQSSKNVATKYFQKDEDPYYIFMGLASIYSSYAQSIIQTFKLSIYDFEYFSYTENEAKEQTQQAIDHFSQIVSMPEIIRINMNFAKGIHLLSQVNFQLGDGMYQLLSNKVDALGFDTKPLKKMMLNAKKFFTAVGDHGLVFLRSCKNIEERLSNMDRFIRLKNIKTKSTRQELTFIGQVQKYLVKGDNKKALDILVAASEDFDIFEQVIKLKARHARLLENKRHAEVSDESYNLEENKITDAISEIVELIEKE